MSGQLVGQVLQHGPADRAESWVLAVIAEDLRGPDRHCALTNTVIATRSRQSVRTVQEALKRLERDGWIARFPGGGRGRVTTYRMLMSRFPVADEPAELPIDPVDNGQIKGATTAPFMAERVQPLPIKGAAIADTPVSVQTSVPPTPHHEHQPGFLLTTGGNGRTDGQPANINPATVIEHVPETARPSVSLTNVLKTAATNGWTAEQLHDELMATDTDWSRVGPGHTFNTIRQLATSQSPDRRPGRPRWCGCCDERTRLIEIREPDGRDTVERCPQCHPLTARERATA